MPSLGADMTEGRIVEWHVHPGDTVRRGDVVAVVETDKADLDVEVWEDAVVAELVAAPGETLAVGEVIARLAAVGTAVETVVEPVVETVVEPAVEPSTGPAVTERPSAGPAGTGPLIRHLADELHVDLARVQAGHPGERVHRDEVAAAARSAPGVPPPAPAAAPPAPAGPRRPRVSPRARRVAAGRGIDVAVIAGTGPLGAVVGADVERARAPSPPSGRRSKAERLAARRRAIGELMSRSWREIPHYRLARRIDMSTLLDWLAARNVDAPVEQRVLPAAALLRATALAAVAVPAVNGTFVDGVHVTSEHVDLGVAVALREGGLVTPAIAAAESKPLDELMGELRDLVTRARAGRLRASETAGATITVTNLGDLGVDEVDGIIFPPQVALVGFGAVRDEAWVVDGSLVARPTLHATLAADHRVSDGRVGGQFLTILERLLKEPEKL